MAYLSPSVTIQQEFKLLPTSITQPLDAVIVGPRKRVVDYSTATNLDLVSYGKYEDINSNELTFNDLPLGARVYSDSIKLNLTDVLARYATLSGSGVIRKSHSLNNKIKLNCGNGAFTGPSRNSAFQNRDVAIGDRVVITGGGATVRSRVTGYVPERIPSSVGSFSAGTSNPSTQTYSANTSIIDDKDTNHEIFVSTSTSTYTGGLSDGVISDTYRLTCILGGSHSTALWNVTSTSGDNVYNIHLPTPVGESGIEFAVGTRGLKAILDLGSTDTFVIGEKYQISVTADYTAITPEVWGTYSGSVDTTYIVTVVKGGKWNESPLISVTTSNGIDYAPSTIVPQYDTVLSLGTLGVHFKFSCVSIAQGGLRLGDTYTVPATAATLGDNTGLTLADSLPPEMDCEDLTVGFQLHKSTLSVPLADYPTFGSEALTYDVTSGTFVVNSGLNILDSTWNDGPIPVESANVYVSYTALLIDNSNSYNSVSSLAEIKSQIGDLVEGNPLAYATYLALENSGGRPVHWVSVSEDNLGGYLEALAALESSDSAYFIVPVSTDLSIQQAVKAHVEKMSSANYGRERVAFVSRNTSQTVDLLGKKSDGTYFTGYVSVDPSNSSVFNRVNVPGAAFLDIGVRAGDIFRTNYAVNADGSTSFSSALVSSVIDNENIILSNPSFTQAVGSVEIPVRVDIARILTKSEYASAISAASSGFGSRRVYNIWPSSAIDSNGVTVPGSYVAAAVAGLKSSVAPQQGITNYVLNGFSSVTLGGRFFTPDQLDTIASGGTLIVNQDVNNSSIYIRHQVSTDQSDSNHSELSITTNLDSIAKFVRPQLKTLIGKYNITPTFLLSAKALLMRNLDYLTVYTSTQTAGPQIVSYDTNAIVVVQDPVLATRVIAKAPITLPYPLNNFDLTLVVV